MARPLDESSRLDSLGFVFCLDVAPSLAMNCP